MIWTDGELAVTKHDWTMNPPFRGHAWQQTGNNYNIGIDLTIHPVEPTEGVVVASMFRAPAGKGGFLDLPYSLVGANSSFILPTLATAQVLSYPTVRSVFHSPPTSLVQDNVVGVLPVNSIEFGIFRNPTDIGPNTTEAQWRAAQAAGPGTSVAWCVANNQKFMGIGDDFFRFEDQRLWTHTGSFRETAIRETAAMLRDSGLCLGVEMVDEVGPEPDAYDPYEFLTWWRDEGGPPLTWPSANPYEWENTTLSDYSSRYWGTEEWRHWREDVLSNWQMLQGIKRANLTPWMSAPRSCIISVAGAFYQKRIAGADYNATYDELIIGGTRPQSIVMQVWLALAYGFSRLRSYGYDWKLWRDQRVNQPPGVIKPGGLQTGTRPGDARYPGFTAAYGSVATRELALNGTPYVPTESGPWVFGRRGNLVWGVNTSEKELPSPNGAGTVITPAGETTSSTVPGGGVILWTI